jgi:hypothetical protein
MALNFRPTDFKAPSPPVYLPLDTPYNLGAVSSCDGPVGVRAVFKLEATENPEGMQCPRTGLKSPRPTTALIRCQLVLPAGPGPEAERALAATETNCYHCKACPNGGCPHVQGTWYSDSYVTTVKGCTSLHLMPPPTSSLLQMWERGRRSIYR